MSKNLYYESQLKNANVRPFEEIQRLDPVWAWIIGFDTLIILIIFIISGVPWWSLIFIIGTMVFVTMFLSKMEMKTRIDHGGIHVESNQMFKKKNRLISWNEVEKMSLRKLEGITERGGYGIRESKKKSFYNLRGKSAIDIMMTNGHQVVIGTRKPDDVERIIGYSHA